MSARPGQAERGRRFAERMRGGDLSGLRGGGTVADWLAS